jgi:orotate phosphoribosyltransferase
MRDRLIALMQATTGHVVYESGHHGNLWLDLDRLWTRPRDLAPFVLDLTRLLPTDDFDVICGPMSGGAFISLAVATELDSPFCYVDRHLLPTGDGVEYVLPKEFYRLVEGCRIALIDDVINAGSATRGAIRALESAGAEITVIGALLVLGSAVPAFASEANLQLVSLAAMSSELWKAEECPLCAEGVPIDLVAT